MRTVKIDGRLKKQLGILFKKDRNRYLILKKKMNEVGNCDDPDHYKNLRVPYQDFKEVHIGTHFVLIFRYVKSEDMIIFEKCCHHNDIFKW